MPRYILSRYTTPISESYSTLDEALAACMKEGGHYVVQGIANDGASLGQYNITVDAGAVQFTFKRLDNV